MSEPLPLLEALSATAIRPSSASFYGREFSWESEQKVLRSSAMGSQTKQGLTANRCKPLLRRVVSGVVCGPAAAVRPGRLQLEAVQVREKLAVHAALSVINGKGLQEGNFDGSGLRIRQPVEFLLPGPPRQLSLVLVQKPGQQVDGTFRHVDDGLHTGAKQVVAPQELGLAR